MNAKDEIARALNELMGHSRNITGAEVVPAFKKSTSCEFFLASGYCPVEIFKNTRVMLGYCMKDHEEATRREYLNSDDYLKLGFEKDMFRKIAEIKLTNMQAVYENKKRLRDSVFLGTNSKAATIAMATAAQELQKVEKELGEALEQASQAAENGDVDGVDRFCDIAAALKARQEELRAANTTTNSNNQQAVCDLCNGRYQTIFMEKKEEHEGGRVHQGFMLLSNLLDTMKLHISEIDPDWLRKETRTWEAQKIDVLRKAERESIELTDTMSFFSSRRSQRHARSRSRSRSHSPRRKRSLRERRRSRSRSRSPHRRSRWE